MASATSGLAALGGATGLNFVPLLSNGSTGFTNGGAWFNTGTDYTIDTVKIGGSGADIPSLPYPPKGVTALTGNASATVSWISPASTGKGPLSGYTVKSSPGGITVAASASASSANVSGLTNGATYTFTVTARNAVGSSLPSQPSNPLTPTSSGAGAAVPSSPTGVTASAGNAQATVSFTAQSSNGGSTITSYAVTASPGGASVAGSGSPLTVTGLTNGTSYTFTVKATNSVGTGPASTASNAVTPTASTAGGGGGGGGAGGSTIVLAVTPQSQTVANGAAASWTISVTNAGGAYIYAVGVATSFGNSCAIPGTFSDTTSLMAPGVTITYSCSLPGVTSSMGASFLASATTGPGPVITDSATVSVTVQGGGSAPVSTSTSVGIRPVNTPSPSKPSTPPATTLTVSAPTPVTLGSAKPKLVLLLDLSKQTKVVVTLLDAHGHAVASWTETEHGKVKLNLPLPAKARHAGHYTIRITAAGKTKTTSVVLRT